MFGKASKPLASHQNHSTDHTMFSN